MLAILLAALESEADKQKFTDIYEQYHPQMEQTALRILKVTVKSPGGWTPMG